MDTQRTLHNNLEHALRKLRLSKDYMQVLALIRQPLDGIKSLKNDTAFKTGLAKELYSDKNVFVDLYTLSGGAQKAPLEVVDHLFSIFDVPFDISSKALNTKNRHP